MFTLINDYPIINRAPTYKKELNAIKKLCKVNKGNFGKKNNQCHWQFQKDLIKRDTFFVKQAFIKRD
jgi:hypothetical protein